MNFIQFATLTSEHAEADFFLSYPLVLINLTLDLVLGKRHDRNLEIFLPHN